MFHGCRAGGRKGENAMKHFLKQHAGACFLAAFAAVGLAFGLGYYFVVGCALGTCPITSNPVASALYGGVMGFCWGISCFRSAGAPRGKTRTVLKTE